MIIQPASSGQPLPYYRHHRAGVGDHGDAPALQIRMRQQFFNIPVGLYPHRRRFFGIDSGEQHHAIASRLLAVEEENIAGHGKRLPQALFYTAVREISAPAEIPHLLASQV